MRWDFTTLESHHSDIDRFIVCLSLSEVNYAAITLMLQWFSFSLMQVINNAVMALQCEATGVVIIIRVKSSLSFKVDYLSKLANMKKSNCHVFAIIKVTANFAV